MPLAEPSTVGDLIKGGAGGIVGFLAAVLGFRTKQVLQDREIQQLRTDLSREVEGIRADIKTLMEREDTAEEMRRLLRVGLQIQVSIARVLHADKRSPDDSLLRILDEADR